MRELERLVKDGFKRMRREMGQMRKVMDKDWN